MVAILISLSGVLLALLVATQESRSVGDAGLPPSF